MVQTQRAPKGFELEVGADEEARARRDAPVAAMPWPPPDDSPEGQVKGWFHQAEEALQAI